MPPSLLDIIDNNSRPGSGGGVHIGSDSITVTNNVVANNEAGGVANDVDGFEFALIVTTGNSKVVSDPKSGL